MTTRKSEIASGGAGESDLSDPEDVPTDPALVMPTIDSAGQAAAGGAASGEATAAEPGEPDESSGNAVRGKRRVTVLLGVAAFALLLDIVSKTLVVDRLAHRDNVRLPGGLINLTLTRNSGAAFSIGQTTTWIFTLIAAAVVVAIVRVSRNLRSLPWALALGLLLGGALGNLGDRVFREPRMFEGHVVDFLRFSTFRIGSWEYDFPVFNLADSAIVVGGILMVLLSFRGIQPDGTRHVAQQDSALEQEDSALEPRSDAGDSRSETL